MIAALRSLLYALVFYAGSVPIVVSAALAAPFSVRLLRRLAWTWAAFFVWCARVFLGVRLVVRGTPPQEGAIVAFKHQSAYETILTLYLFEKPAVVMKAELRKIPVWGYVAARHGSIFVERAKGGAALKSMLRQARAAVGDGRPVLLFPEGTRVPVGEAPRLRSGFAGLYAALGVPAVPVSLDAGRTWRRRGFVKRPGVVTVKFEEPIPPGLPREEAEAMLHAAINRAPTA